MNSGRSAFLAASAIFYTTISQAFPAPVASPPIPDEMSGLRVPHSALQEPGLGAFEQAIGFYSDGRLRNASRLEWEGPGILKLFRSRNREYSTSDLQKLLLDSAMRLSQAFPEGERLQIGDLSAERGGPIGLHASHQNGLDVDVVYLRVNRHEQDPDSPRGFEEIFVQGDGELSRNFDLDRNWFLLSLLVATNRVNRIFVDEKIKTTLCQYVAQAGKWEESAAMETLRRLRPWPNHDDHFHLRIHCPEGNTRCIAQEPPPEGSGC